VPGLGTPLGGAENTLIAAHGSPTDVHGELPAQTPVTLEVDRALHGQHPTCQSLWETMTNTATADTVNSLELGAATVVAVLSPPVM
jgi:hypothetical protein